MTTSIDFSISHPDLKQKDQTAQTNNSTLSRLNSPNHLQNSLLNIQQHKTWFVMLERANQSSFHRQFD